MIRAATSRASLLLSLSACAAGPSAPVRTDEIFIAQPVEAATAAPSASAEAQPEITGPVRLVGEDSYEVLAELFDAIVERRFGFDEVSFDVVIRENEQRAVQLSGIRRGSVPDKLGLQNDDLIEAVNGYPMTDEPSRRLALASVRTAARASVIVIREGERRLLEYTLVYH